MTIAEDIKETPSDTAPLPSILFVEDESSDFVVARHELKGIKVRNPVHLVSTADEMFKYLHGQHPYEDRAKFPLPAVIVVDLHLPDIDGLRIQAMLRSGLKFRQIPIIVISSAERRTTLQTAVDLGADSYLVKPFEAEDFQRIAQRLGLPMEFGAGPR